MKTIKLRPGDKVRVTEDIYRNEDVADLLCAPKGSTATVLSYDEFYGHLRGNWSDDTWAKRPSYVFTGLTLQKKHIDEGTEYPVRFDIVIQPSEKVSSAGFFVDCKVGDIEVLPAEALEKITEARKKIYRRKS